MDQYLALNIGLLLDSCQLHSVLPEAVLSSGFDICNSFHSLDGLDVEIPIVLNWFITFLFELEDRVFGDLFVIKLSGSLGPC